MLIVGSFIVGGAALFCSLGCSGRESRWCSSPTLICNAILIFTASVVLAILIVNGMQLLSPEAWDAVRNGGVNAASSLGSNGTADGIVEVVGDVLSPGFVRPFTVLLAVLLFLGVSAEVYILCVHPRTPHGERTHLREVELGEAAEEEKPSCQRKGAPTAAPPSSEPPAEDTGTSLIRSEDGQRMAAEV